MGGIFPLVSHYPLGTCPGTPQLGSKRHSPFVSKQKKPSVKILNPIGSQYTSLDRATRFVRSGYAEWEGKAIRFKDWWLERCLKIKAQPKLMSLRTINRIVTAYRLRTMDEAGYDGV